MHTSKTAGFTRVNRQSFRRKLVLFPAVVLFAGCRTANTDVPAYARILQAVAPNMELKSVRLGMSYAELVKARPAIRPLGYVGAFEVMAGDTIRYYLQPIPREPDSDDPSADIPKDNATLVGVEKWMIAKSTAESEQAWSHDVARFFNVTGLECFNYARGTTQSVAIAPVADVWIGAVHMPQFNVANPPTDFPARHTVFVTSDRTKLVPTTLKTTSIACPAK